MFLAALLKNNLGVAIKEDRKRMVNDVLVNVLEYLQILDHMGTTFPNWMISLSFTKLNLEFKLKSRAFASSGGAATPQISTVYGLQKVGVQFLGIESTNQNGIIIFPMLKDLYLES